MPDKTIMSSVGFILVAVHSGLTSGHDWGFLPPDFLRDRKFQLLSILIQSFS